MNLEEVLEFVDEIVFAQTQKHLKDVQVSILQGAWKGQNYEEIAKALGYTDGYLKQDVGPALWKLLSSVFGEKVSKTNFQSAVERQWHLWKQQQACKEAPHLEEPQIQANIQ